VPALSIIYKSSNNGSEEVAAREQESIQPNISTSLMREVDISHTNLAKALDGGSNKALYDFACAKTEATVSECLIFFSIT
jgi:DNA-binding protein Fis